MNRFSHRLFGPQGFHTYAAWPVWSFSTTKEVRYHPMPKKQAVILYRKAREFDRQTRKKGQRGGAIGPTGLRVLETLIFDFMNFRTGQLDPSHETIARHANLCVRAVRSALRRLRELGIIRWLRRCSERRDGNRFMLIQDTNAYAVLPSTQWRGFADTSIVPPPHPEAWGACPPLPPVIEQALADRKDGCSFGSMVSVLDSDPRDGLAQALARFGRAVETRNP